ncbi:protein RALF-like 4 [Neltuma alba]|uniref:protein RALF-like 4 n=1 Tax=Neltuma alba TaxID=207710 RepID=UPI0010A3A5DC|nr:protein RALF-like 4 [Prosopis alba]
MELKLRNVVLAVAVSAMAMAMATEATSEEWNKEFSMDGQLVGDKVSEEEEMMMMMEVGSARRSLQGGKTRHITYDALKSDRIQCGYRGRSYYDCNRRDRANPYRRGCTAVTHCARNTD